MPTRKPMTRRQLVLTQRRPNEARMEVDSEMFCGYFGTRRPIIPTKLSFVRTEQPETAKEEEGGSGSCDRSPVCRLRPLRPHVSWNAFGLTLAFFVVSMHTRSIPTPKILDDAIFIKLLPSTFVLLRVLLPSTTTSSTTTE